MTNIFDVTQNGDLAALRRLVEACDDNEIDDYVNSQQSVSGVAPMHIASKLGFLDIIQYLYEMGASLDITDMNDRTPLHYAAMGAQKDACNFLIDQGAFLDTKGDPEIAQIFIDNGTDINGPVLFLYFITVFIFLYSSKSSFFIFYNITPISLACTHGFPEIVSLLIEAGARFNPKQKGAATPLILTINAAKDSGSQDSFARCIEILLKNGADVNKPDSVGNTPLILSIQYNLKAIAKVLLRSHPNVNAVNNLGETAAFYCLNDKSDILQLLIKENVDLTRKYQNNMTLLHLAFSKYIESSFAKLLLDNGLEPDSEDIYGNTPLHYAVEKISSEKSLSENSQEIIKLLIRAGCDPTHANLKGRTCFAVSSAKIANLMAETMNEPEAVQNRAQRAEYKQEEENKLMDERLEKRAAMNATESKGERNARTPINHVSTLRAMTKGGGTLRTLPKQWQKTLGSSEKTQKTTGKEARPWGGSRETAKFQRETRLYIRKLKNEVMSELKHLNEDIRGLKKEIFGLDSESENEQGFSMSEATSGNQNSQTEDEQLMSSQQIPQQQNEQPENQQQEEQQEDPQQEQNEEQNQQIEQQQVIEQQEIVVMEEVSAEYSIENHEEPKGDLDQQEPSFQFSFDDSINNSHENLQSVDSAADAILNDLVQ